MRQSGRFPDRIEGFQKGWKISDRLEDFWIFGKILDSLGSILFKHMSPERNATQTAFTGKIHIDWNGPVVSRADHLLSASLDGWFGSRGRWHFKTRRNKFYTSEVVDRNKSGVSI